MCARIFPSSISFVPALLLLTLGIPLSARGQDTLKVMTYNLLNYNSSDTSRDGYFRTVIAHTPPDVLVVQEIAVPAGADSFFTRVLDRLFPGEYTMGTFINGPDSDNGIYYKQAKISFLWNTPVATPLRDINEFALFHQASAETLRIYSLHLKAGNTATDRNARAIEVDSLRRVTDALPDGSHFMVVGDFNIYAATESAYVRLLRNNLTDGHFLDAETLAGTWNNAAYAMHHTQSPRVRSFGGGANGGMDDRFDLILYSEGISTPEGIHLLPGSIVNVGNDGNHYNDSINAMPNSAVPAEVASALHYAADHIPVTALLRFHSAIPDPPVLVSPAHQSSGQPVSPLLRWRTSPLAQSYRLQLSADSLFGSTIIDNAGLTDTVLQVDTLPSGTVHYWRVSASGTGGTSAFSLPYEFSTISGVSRQYSVIDGWNMISAPLAPDDPRTVSLFPSAASQAFVFHQGSGYTPEDTIENGVGYWLKFTGAQQITLTGELRSMDSVSVQAGWNMIGSLSAGVSTSAITTMPPDIIVSQFFFYDLGYVAADSLLPIEAYWVKVSAPGVIILESGEGARTPTGP